MPEQFVLDQAFGYCAAVDGNERLIAPGAAVVNGPGRDLLARAGFALDQDGGVGLGDALDQPDRLQKRRRMPDQVRSVTRLTLAPCRCACWESAMSSHAAASAPAALFIAGRQVPSAPNDGCPKLPAEFVR
jgi:hypothetical protein